MVPRETLVRFLDDLLRLPAGGVDPSNNGLQVEGAPEVRRAVFGVDACLELFRQAAERQADFVFVHHGLSWKGGIRRITGVTGRRVGFLMRHGISLYACHLPLDAHPEVGHNAVLARALDLREPVPFFTYAGIPIGLSGSLPQPASAGALAQTLARVLGAIPEVYGTEERPIRTLGVVSGGAADAVEDAAVRGLDALVTGEVGHEHVHIVRESGVTVFAGGHYYTECPGIRAVMERVAAEFALPCEFLDLPTGK